MAVRDEARESLRATVAHYENTITWGTTCHGCASLLDASIKDTQRAEAAEAANARVRDLHKALDIPGYSIPMCEACGGDCMVPWPCETIRALDGEDG